MTKTSDSGRLFVGAGFTPGFKFKQKFLKELERGHKARAYEPATVEP